MKNPCQKVSNGLFPSPPENSLLIAVIAFQRAFLVAELVKNPPAMEKTSV